MINFLYNFSMDIPFIMFILIGIAIYTEKHTLVNYLIVCNFLYALLMRLLVWK
jgi:hypothetical protein